YFPGIPENVISSASGLTCALIQSEHGLPGAVSFGHGNISGHFEPGPSFTGHGIRVSVSLKTILFSLRFGSGLNPEPRTVMRYVLSFVSGNALCGMMALTLGSGAISRIGIAVGTGGGGLLLSVAGLASAAACLSCKV